MHNWGWVRYTEVKGNSEDRDSQFSHPAGSRMLAAGIQLTLQQHECELQSSTYKHIFFQ